MRAWRLLSDPAASGWWNMAIDEMLLASVASGGPPTLRLYAWQGPWVSLGYAQTLSPERREAWRSVGVRVVRRVTGGRAVLHGRDLTYAIVSPSDGFPATLEASYALVSRALVGALAELGVRAHPIPQAPSAGRPRGFDCFAEASAEEICAGGRKLVGSAQRRGAGCVLQHGSIRLAPDPPRVVSATGLGSPASISLAELGAPAGAPALRQALADGFRLALRAPIRPGTLSADERRAAARRAERLRQEPLTLRRSHAPAISRASLDGR